MVNFISAYDDLLTSILLFGEYQNLSEESKNRIIDVMRDEKLKKSLNKIHIPYLSLEELYAAFLISHQFSKSIDKYINSGLFRRTMNKLEKNLQN